METKGRTNIEIIQGDSFNKEISVLGIDFSLIKSIFFSCDKLNICKQLERDDKNQVFILKLTPSETSNFPILRGTYDFTLEFLDNKIKTGVYNGTIAIYEKINRVHCLE